MLTEELPYWTMNLERNNFDFQIPRRIPLMTWLYLYCITIGTAVDKAPTK